MKITKYPQSAILIEYKDKKILIDPGSYCYNKFYHSGDTIYFEQKLKAEIIFVPICGTVVMNLKEAARFSKDINPKLTIPIHYDNPRFPVDVNEFVNEMKGHNVKVLKNGESIELD